MSGQLRPSCCRRGYWNAIAYGSAAIWVVYVVLAYLQMYFYNPYDRYTDPIFHFLFYHVHLWYIHHLRWAIERWVWHQLPHPWMISLIRSQIPYEWIYFALAAAVQWIVFLGMLRLYWWTRRKPVTGWSALFAVLVMAAVVTLTNYLYHWRPS